MSIIEIIFVSFIALITVATHVLNFFQKELIKGQQEQLKFYEGDRTKNDLVLKYCLDHILNDAVARNDFETADRCKEALGNLNENKGR